MLIALIISMLFNMLLTGGLVVSIVVMLRFYRFTAHYEDNLNDCLDDLDASYGRMAQLMNRPLLADSPEIRQIVAELDSVHKTILHMARNIARTDDERSKEGP